MKTRLRISKVLIEYLLLRVLTDALNTVLEEGAQAQCKCYYHILLPPTSSTAQGGGGSFNYIGEVSCGDAWMAERIH